MQKCDLLEQTPAAERQRRGVKMTATQTDDKEEVRRGKVSAEEAREEDGKGDRGEMRGAIGPVDA